MPSPSGRGGSGAAGLFVISAAILTLEVLQTRLFSYCLSPLLIYAAVGVALLGLGASGTALSLWEGWRRYSLGSIGAWASAGFSASLIGAHVLFAYSSSGLTLEIDALALVIFAALAIPYFCAGLAVTACLAAAGKGVHVTYLLNLIGSGAGCFVVFLVLKPLGAPALLTGVALIGVLAGVLFLRAGGGWQAKAALGVASLAALAPLLAPQSFFPFEPDPTGQLAVLRRAAQSNPDLGIQVEQVYEAWDPTGRIEFHSFEPLQANLPDPVPFRFYSQDGSAGSVAFGVEDDLERAVGFFERTLYGAAYHLHGGGEGASVLIIGLGGGPDVLTAQHFKAASVTGVDINASAIEALRGPLAAFTGNPYDRPGLRTVRIDGRTFARSTDATFDLMIMSGVDTKTALASGSLAISENSLYTVEAFCEYLDLLRPGGVLALLRFGGFEQLRLAGIGVAALRQRGVAEPERHFVALQQGIWTLVMITRDPVAREAIERITTWVAGVPRPDTGIRLPVYDSMGFGLSDAPELLYPHSGPGELPEIATYFAAVAQGAEAEYIAAHETDLSPTTDDRPFFFDPQRKDRLFSAPLYHYKQLAWFLIVVTVLAGLAIAVPIPVFLRRRDRQGGMLRTLTYFLSLGLGFMILEIGFIQKLVLFLGHQTYAITVVLATLLVSAGLGSAVSGRFTGPGSRSVRFRAVPAILLAAVVLFLALDHLAPLAAPLPLGARILLAFLALFPLGFALGIPFPTGLAALSSSAPGLVPWAVAANGFASVVGAAVALPGAMIFGYRSLLIAGGALYVLAAISFPSRSSPE